MIISELEVVKPSSLLVSLLKQRIRRLQDRILDKQSTINILTSQLAEYRNNDPSIHRPQTNKNRRVQSQ